MRDGVTGFLVQPGSGSALAEAVAILAADRAGLAAQGKAAREMVLGRSWPVMCDELIGHYESVLRARRGVQQTEREEVAAPPMHPA